VRSINNTLLTRMGFRDPDSKNQRHNLACQYLSQYTVMKRLVKSVYRVGVAEAKCIQEFHLTKGHGQYKTSIGFLDLVALLHVFDKPTIPDAPGCRNFDNDEEYERSYPSEEEITKRHIARKIRSCNFNAETGTVQITVSDLSYLAIEVKISKAPVGEILKQFRLYKEFLEIPNDWRWTKLPRKEGCAPVDSSWGSLVESHKFNNNYPWGLDCLGCCDFELWKDEISKCKDDLKNKFSPNWILVTDYQINQMDKDSLLEAGIQHAVLGPNFDAYVKSVMESDRNPSTSAVI